MWTMPKNPTDEPVPGTPPAGTMPEERLDSWKEIAAYLNRDVTTVQRWEKREGMPVHRHLHDKRGSVYALSSEIDAWRQSRKVSLEEERQESAAEVPTDWFRCQRPHPFLFVPASTASSILCSPLNMCWRCFAARYQTALPALVSTGSPTDSSRSLQKYANCAQPEIGQRLAG